MLTNKRKWLLSDTRGLLLPLEKDASSNLEFLGFGSKPDQNLRFLYWPVENRTFECLWVKEKQKVWRRLGLIINDLPNETKPLISGLRSIVLNQEPVWCCCSTSGQQFDDAAARWFAVSSLPVGGRLVIGAPEGPPVRSGLAGFSPSHTWPTSVGETQFTNACVQRQPCFPRSPHRFTCCPNISSSNHTENPAS